MKAVLSLSSYCAKQVLSIAVIAYLLILLFQFV